MPLSEASEFREPALLVRIDVIEDQDLLPIDGRLVRAAHDERAIESLLELLRLIRMRMEESSWDIRLES